MDNMNQQFLLSLLIILLGYTLKRVDLIKEQDGECLSRIVLNITLPALIISTFSKLTVDLSLLSLTLISLIYGLAMGAIGIWVFKKHGRSTRGMLSMLLPGFNIGLFAYPLVEAIWGQEGVKYFGMFDVGNALIIFGLCYLIASHYSAEATPLSFKSVVDKLSRSIPLVAYIIAFCLNIAGLQLPAFLTEASAIVAKANMPLSLLLLGVYLEFSFNLSYGKNMSKVIAIRYIVGLVAGITLFFSIPFESLFKYTLLIGFILPIGMAVIPFAVEFNYDQKFVGTLANITTLISFVLIWLIVGASGTINYPLP